MKNNYKRKKEPTENRNLILDSAIQIVIEEGLEKLTIGNVASKANLTKGGVMHHFPRKEELLSEVFNGRLKEFTDVFNQELLVDPTSRPLAYLKASAKFEPSEEYDGVLKVMFQAILQYDQYRKMLQAWYKEHVCTDINDCSHNELAAIVLADGLLLSYLTGNFSYTTVQKKIITEFFNA